MVAVGATGPHELIVHWAGQVRRRPWWDYAFLVPAIGLPIIAGLGVVGARFTRTLGMNPWMPAIVVGVTVFHAVGLGIGLVVLNSSALAPRLPLGGGLVLGVMAALLTRWLLPKEAPSPTPIESAAAIPVRIGEIAAWTGRTDRPTWLLVVSGLLAALGLTTGTLLAVTVGWPALPAFLVGAVSLSVLFACSEFVVSAGPAGLLVRSIIGWPRLRIRAADIATAGVIDVNPLAEFGGSGLRWVIGPRGKGRWGILTRQGAALEVIRHDGRSLVATIDDPATAASVLQKYAKENQ